MTQNGKLLAKRVPPSRGVSEDPIVLPLALVSAMIDAAARDTIFMHRLQGYMEGLGVADRRLQLGITGGVVLLPIAAEGKP